MHAVALGSGDGQERWGSSADAPRGFSVLLSWQLEGMYVGSWVRCGGYLADIPRVGPLMHGILSPLRRASDARLGSSIKLCHIVFGYM